jgi:hypothetical protein
MADKYKSEMGLKDFVESGAFEPGSRAYEKAMQDEVDQAVERNKTIKGAKKALERIKFKEKMESGAGYARAVPGLGSLLGSTAKVVADVRSKVKDMRTSGMSDDQIKQSSFNKGGSVMAKGNKLARSKPTKIC